MKENNYKTDFISALSLLILICVYPFFVTNNYHNITISKYYFFNIASVLLFFICSFALLIDDKRGDNLNRIKSKFGTADFFACLFLIEAIVSCVFSADRMHALSGTEGRHMGLVTFIAMVTAYFLVSKFYTCREIDMAIFAASVIFMTLFGFLQFLGFDPMNMLSTVAYQSRSYFIGFVGNVDVYSSYLCLAVPLVAELALLSRSDKLRILWYVAVGAGFLGFFSSNSDSGVMGLTVCLFILFIQSCKHPVYFRRFWTVIAVFFISSGLFYSVNYFRRYEARTVESVFKYLLNPAIFICGMAICAIIIILLTKFDIKQRTLRIIRISALVLTGLLAAATIIAFIYFTFFDRFTLLGYFGNYLRFDNYWGSHRGFIWKKCLSAYGSLPAFKKLIGFGEDMVPSLLISKFGTSFFPDEFIYNIDNAHSELVQYLVTVGFWGLISYLGVFITVIVKGIKSDSIIKKAVCLSVFGYFVQGLVNITQPITTPLMFVFLGLAAADVSKNYDKTRSSHTDE